HTIKMNPIRDDRFDIPCLTSGNHEIVCQLVVKRIERRFEVLRRGGVCRGIVVLIVENDLWSSRRSRNRQYMRATNATGRQGNVRHSRQVWNTANVIGKKPRATFRIRGGILEGSVSAAAPHIFSR